MKNKEFEILLAIESATPVCSIALRTKNGRVTEKRIEGQGVHSEKTFLFIQELLERANLDVSELDAVLFSNGPGSYTGLRIGAAAIKGLLFRKDIPLYTFPTLLSFATPSVLDKKNGIVHAVIDARREHLYTQQVKDSGKTVSEPQIMELTELNKMITPGDTIIGTGWERLNLNESEKLNMIGSEGISAVNLIKAFGDPTLQKHFKKDDIETFEPDYLTMAQINNSPIQR